MKKDIGMTSKKGKEQGRDEPNGETVVAARQNEKTVGI